MSEPVTQDPQPMTPTGRALFTDNEPGDMLESDGVTWDDVIAIEAESATRALTDLRERVDTLPSWDGSESFVMVRDLYALIDDAIAAQKGAS